MQAWTATGEITANFRCPRCVGSPSPVISNPATGDSGRGAPEDCTSACWGLGRRRKVLRRKSLAFFCPPVFLSLMPPRASHRN